MAALPGTIADITPYLDIVFVDKKKPTDEVLKKTFPVKTADITSVLNSWRDNGHPAYQRETWDAPNVAALEALADAQFKDTFDASITVVAPKDDAKVDAAAQSYTNYADEKDFEDSSRPVEMERCGVVNANMAGLDAKKADATVQVRHEDDPVNRYYNPSYWANSFPWLFPYGCGGAENNTRPASLSLIEWVRHLLNLEDARFREDPAFMFIAFDIVYRRAIYQRTKYVYTKVYTKNDTAKINEPTVDDFDECLKWMNKKSNLGNDPHSKKIRQMLQRMKRVGSKVAGSVYDREACRNKIMAIISEHGLPNTFVTINPSDIHNLIVSYWSCLSTDEQFDLDKLMPDDQPYPDANARASFVAKDPVLCAQFFNKFITAFLSAFLGFDPDESSTTFSSSSRDGHTVPGPLLNKTIFTGNHERGLKAFYGTVETSGRGSLHLHLLIWLNGQPTPQDLTDRINIEMAKLCKAAQDSKDSAMESADEEMHPIDAAPAARKSSTVVCDDGKKPLASSNIAKDTSAEDDVASAPDDVAAPDDPPLTGWLKGVAEYLDSIIEQSYPRFTDEEELRIPAMSKDHLSLLQRCPNHSRADTGPRLGSTGRSAPLGPQDSEAQISVQGGVLQIRKQDMPLQLPPTDYNGDRF